LGELEARRLEQLVFAMIEDDRAWIGHSIAALCVTSGSAPELEDLDEDGEN